MGQRFEVLLLAFLHEKGLKRPKRSSYHTSHDIIVERTSDDNVVSFFECFHVGGVAIAHSHKLLGQSLLDLFFLLESDF